MKFLVISDLHAKIENLKNLENEFKTCDAVLFAGDFAEFGKPETFTPTFDALLKQAENIFCVLGNCDDKKFLVKIESADISVQNAIAFFNGLAFAGSGGGSKFTGTTPFERTDEELAMDLEIAKKTQLKNLIAIMHNPPKDCDCDKIKNGAHVGSPLLRKFIEEQKPLAVITGHIHESRAICKIENTIVINPGALLEGNYAILTAEKIDCDWHIFAELKNCFENKKPSP